EDPYLRPRRRCSDHLRALREPCARGAGDRRPADRRPDADPVRRARDDRRAHVPLHGGRDAAPLRRHGSQPGQQPDPAAHPRRRRRRGGRAHAVHHPRDLRPELQEPELLGDQRRERRVQEGHQRVPRRVQEREVRRVRLLRRPDRRGRPRPLRLRPGRRAAARAHRPGDRAARGGLRAHPQGREGRARRGRDRRGRGHERTGQGAPRAGAARAQLLQGAQDEHDPLEPRGRLRDGWPGRVLRHEPARAARAAGAAGAPAGRSRPHRAGQPHRRHPGPPDVRCLRRAARAAPQRVRRVGHRVAEGPPDPPPPRQVRVLLRPPRGVPPREVRSPLLLQGGRPGVGQLPAAGRAEPRPLRARRRGRGPGGQPRRPRARPQPGRVHGPM
ncbi:MAG: hypothetical protein AVDCRST_MAG30-2028, partial [uncultured Solirubrobacteraceae bacterium]